MDSFWMRPKTGTSAEKILAYGLTAATLATLPGA